MPCHGDPDDGPTNSCKVWAENLQAQSLQDALVGRKASAKASRSNTETDAVRDLPYSAEEAKRLQAASYCYLMYIV